MILLLFFVQIYSPSYNTTDQHTIIRHDRINRQMRRTIGQSLVCTKEHFNHPTFWASLWLKFLHTCQFSSYTNSALSIFEATKGLRIWQRLVQIQWQWKIQRQWWRSRCRYQGGWCVHIKIINCWNWKKRNWVWLYPMPHSVVLRWILDRDRDRYWSTGCCL